MLDLTKVENRYFEVIVKNQDSGEVLTLELKTPTVKMIKKLDGQTKAVNEGEMGELSNLTVQILNWNRKGQTVPESLVDDMGLDQIYTFFTSYTQWVREIQNSKN